jgi:hypothetical protein
MRRIGRGRIGSGDDRRGGRVRVVLLLDLVSLSMVKVMIHYYVNRKNGHKMGLTN